MATEFSSQNVLMDQAETLRKMWQHEDTFANNRLIWFNTAQGLLLASPALKPAAVPLLRRLDCYRLHGVEGLALAWNCRESIAIAISIPIHPIPRN